MNEKRLSDLNWKERLLNDNDLWHTLIPLKVARNLCELPINQVNTPILALSVSSCLSAGNLNNSGETARRQNNNAPCLPPLSKKEGKFIKNIQTCAKTSTGYCFGFFLKLYTRSIKTFLHYQVFSQNKS